jgi:hypothetical protein
MEELIEKWKWQDVENGTTRRMRVDDGYVLQTYTTVIMYGKEFIASQALVFIPERRSRKED